MYSTALDYGHVSPVSEAESIPTGILPTAQYWVPVQGRPSWVGILLKDLVLLPALPSEQTSWVTLPLVSVAAQCYHAKCHIAFWGDTGGREV